MGASYFFPHRSKGPAHSTQETGGNWLHNQVMPQLAQLGITHQSWQQEASDRDSWHSSVRKASCEFEPERHKATKEKHRRQKERAASLPSSSQTSVHPKCGRGCVSRIGLYSHQQACKKLTLNLPNNPRLRGMSQSTARGYIRAEYEF